MRQEMYDRIRAIRGLVAAMEAAVVKPTVFVSASSVGTYGFNAASFINYGHDFSSLLMSLGFLLALVSYLFGLYLTAPTSR
ncbi:MAG TPA: hypothetical protein VKT82_16695 [Ktedonobacterales bacterium]|nr:hypothetical protein [Ktedonobacterales bacterium]